MTRTVLIVYFSILLGLLGACSDNKGLTIDFGLQTDADGKLGSIVHKIKEDAVNASISLVFPRMETGLECQSVVDAQSSDEKVLAKSGLKVEGRSPDCRLVLTPEKNKSGKMKLYLEHKPAKNQQGSSQDIVFSVTINLEVEPVEDPPTMELPDNLVTIEDKPLLAVPISLEDPDGPLICSSALSGNSADKSLITNEGITFNGKYPDCSMSLTPQPNANGITEIELKATDGKNVISKVVSLNVLSENDPPSFIKIENQSMKEDEFIKVAFKINDFDSDITCQKSVIAKNNNSVLFPPQSFAVSGELRDCYLSIQPAKALSGTGTFELLAQDESAVTSVSFTVSVEDFKNPPTIAPILPQQSNEDVVLENLRLVLSDPDSVLKCKSSISAVSANKDLVPDNSITFSGEFPNCSMLLKPAAYGSGETLVTVTVTDGNSSTSQSFKYTVKSVNNAPSIASIPDVYTTEDVPAKEIMIKISDVDGPHGECNSNFLSYVSNWEAVVSNTGAVTWGGQWPNCTAIVKPGPDKYARPVFIVFYASDGIARSLGATVNLWIEPTPDDQTFLASETTIVEDSGPARIAFTIRDPDSKLSCSDIKKIPSAESFDKFGSSADGWIVQDTTTIQPTSNAFNYFMHPTWPNLNCYFTATPQKDKNGLTEITLSWVSSKMEAVKKVIFINIVPINDVPTISGISDIALGPDESSREIAFKINDVDDNLSCTSSIRAFSSNTLLIPSEKVEIFATTSGCIARLSRNTLQRGTSEITLVASDGKLSSKSSFLVVTTPIAPILQPAQVSGFYARIQGSCDSTATSHKATSSIGAVVSATCSQDGVFSVVVNLPPGKDNFTITAQSANKIGSPAVMSAVSFSRVPATCPNGYVGVPASAVPGIGNPSASPDHTNWSLNVNKDFCVMKYPVKKPESFGTYSKVENLTPSDITTLSRDGGSVWMLNYTDASRICQLYGADYKLLSNTQWQTVVENLKRAQGKADNVLENRLSIELARLSSMPRRVVDTKSSSFLWPGYVVTSAVYPPTRNCDVCWGTRPPEYTSRLPFTDVPDPVCKESLLPKGYVVVDEVNQYEWADRYQRTYSCQQKTIKIPDSREIVCLGTELPAEYKIDDLSTILGKSSRCNSVAVIRAKVSGRKLFSDEEIFDFGDTSAHWVSEEYVDLKLPPFVRDVRRQYSTIQNITFTDVRYYLQSSPSILTTHGLIDLELFSGGYYDRSSATTYHKVLSDYVGRGGRLGLTSLIPAISGAQQLAVRCVTQPK